MELNLLVESNNALTLELNRARLIIDQFIHSCSHNLRGPLTSIEGLVTLAKESTTPEDLSASLDLIRNCTTRMKEMIEKLDAYTCNRNREFVSEKIEPALLVERVLDECQHEIDMEGVTVSTRIVQHENWFGDEHVHYLILKNLVRNAIAFSDPLKKNKMLQVDININNDLVNMDISDNGIGIIDSERENIYTPFYRCSVQSKGDGLGLFLVNGLIEKLRASISFQSTDQIGTSVVLSTPNYKATG